MNVIFLQPHQKDDQTILKNDGNQKGALPATNAPFAKLNVMVDGSLNVDQPYEKIHKTNEGMTFTTKVPFKTSTSIIEQHENVEPPQLKCDDTHRRERYHNKVHASFKTISSEERQTDHTCESADLYVDRKMTNKISVAQKSSVKEINGAFVAGRAPF
jgi:hypothetical protein